MTTNVNLGFVAAAGGTVNAITATYSPAPTALVDKMLLWFRATGANTSTAPTFSPNGLTARTIVKQGGTALVAGDIPAANAIMEVVYDATNTRWELLNPANSGTYEPFVPSYTTAQIAGLVGMTLRERVFNTTNNDYEWYDGTRWVKEAHPKYKVYTALLTQTGTNNPTVTVLENNLSGAIVWARNGAGGYLGNLNGAFPVAKTCIPQPAISSPLNTINIARISDNQLNISTFEIDFVGETFTQIDGVLSATFIEIRVYY